ncbi:MULTISPECIES: ectoine/hydroxyectoine ABC transporter substrate-binding protein EhuB [Bradyrhizobium]|uniref:ectoine/hydroxyectoine ABC transporter substrate-binding protein EhuB n=1 Tax=Bradyrhizobium TaxID=374 RepID=UPI000687B46F|nr:MULTISPECIES: ectoine/hydroxyectoine ABC transporter substrate-binding protein EhuB [Bradyrhizobium]UFW51296.1 ectoine/hydroxyectoine ABC transporter substrate-binding protein EhuB [Bradyrhizobium arachidis]
MRAMLNAFSLVLLLNLAAYPFQAFAQTENALSASVRKAGSIKVAIASFPPYMTMSPSGEATGIWIDLQNMILKSMSLPEMTPVITQWDSMTPGLQARQFDYVASLVISEERCKAMIFSAPHYAYQIGLHVRAGNPKHLMSVAEIAHRPDIKVAIISGAPWLTYALKQGIKSEQIVRVPDVQAGVATVNGGRADAYIESQFAVSNPEQKGVEVVVDKASPISGSAAVFRKEDARLRDAYNEKLKMLVSDGTIQKLYQKQGLPGGEEQASLLANTAKAGDLVPSCE